MKYKFPVIEHIDDVLPHVKDHKDFVVVEKDHFTVINYVVMGNDTFPAIESEKDTILRECRGITFCNKTGKILQRKFHKFFNVGEREETMLENIDLTQPHIILEKLDGSMIVPVLIDDEHVRWTTKMGITDVAKQAEVFVARHPEYEKYARGVMLEGYTPIFEWCSRQNQIVIDHPEDRLVLLAVRDMKTGEYMSYIRMKKTAEVFGIPVVEAFDMKNKSLEEIIDIIHAQEDSEGIIIRFHDGHMVKIKSEWYCNLHRVKSEINNERNVVRLILDNGLDDLKSFMPKEDLDRIELFQDEVLSAIEAKAIALQLYWDSLQDRGLTRKDFAVEIAPNLDPLTKNAMFKWWDEEKVTIEDARALAIDNLRKHLSKNEKYDTIKRLYNIMGMDDERLAAHRA